MPSDAVQGIGGNKEIPAPEGNRRFGKEDGLKVFQASSKPRAGKKCSGRLRPSRWYHQGFVAEGFHYGGEVGIGFVLPGGFWRISHKRHLFLWRVAAQSKIIKQVAQVHSGGLLACPDGKSPVPANLLHGFGVSRFHGLDN